jgi:hypothetical protein
MGPPDSAGLKEVAALCPKAHMQIRAVRILEVSLMIFLRPESQVLEGSVNTGGRLDRLRQLTPEQRANRIAYLKDQININDYNKGFAEQAAIKQQKQAIADIFRNTRTA